MRLRRLITSQPSDLLTLSRGVFYGWWLVGAAAFLLGLISLCVFQGLGTFLDALEEEFEWSRTALTGAFVLARAETAVIGPLEGFLIDRFGSRRMILIGYLTMGAGFVLFSQIHNLWQFYAVFMLISVGSGLGGWLAILAVINNWFSRHRSFAMASAMSGIHIGGFLLPILALGIQYHGFRWTTFGIGIFLLAVSGPMARLIRNSPEDYGLRPDGDTDLPSGSRTSATDRTAETEGQQDFTVSQALRTQAFWMLTMVQVSSSVAIVTLSVHLVPKLTDMELTPVGATMVVLTYTAIALVTQFVAGYIGDQLPKQPLLFVFLVFQATAIMIIALAESVSMAYLFAVIYGIGFGGRIPLLVSIRGEFFGRKSFATLMGLSSFPNNLAMMGVPLFAAYMFDTRGSYFIPFISLAILNYLGAVLTLSVKKPVLAATAQESRTAG